MLNKPEIIKETSRGIEKINTVSELYTSGRMLFLNGSIGSEECAGIITSLFYLEKTDPDSPVTLIINSPGGEVRSGLAVYDVLSLMKSPVITVCMGQAASMGSIIFLAGDKRIMLPHSELMIHDPSYGSFNADHMKPHEIQERVDSLRKTGDELVRIVVNRTGNDEETIRQKMKEDSFFNADEALAFGLATKIAGSLKEVLP